MCPGPAPKHPSVRARRNNPKAGFRSLAVAGRVGKTVPVWPLEEQPAVLARLELNRDRVVSLQVQVEGAEDSRSKGRLRAQLNTAELTVATLQLQLEQARDGEVALWSELWGTPQAELWEESHSERVVALYVRQQIAAEQGDMKAATEARQLGDRLGLNPLALLRLRTEIEQVEKAEADGKKRRQAAVPSKPKGETDDPRGLFAVK
jgi:hypothetical protein